MPVKASLPDSAPASVVLSMCLTTDEFDIVQAMLSEFLHGEYEAAQELYALGRPCDVPITRAALCLRIAAMVAAAAPVS